jgi:hypothetical protein
MDGEPHLTWRNFLKMMYSKATSEGLDRMAEVHEKKEVRYNTKMSLLVLSVKFAALVALRFNAQSFETAKDTPSPVRISTMGVVVCQMQADEMEVPNFSDLQDLEAMWALWDEDGSGELDKDEFSMALKMLQVCEPNCIRRNWAVVFWVSIISVLFAGG